MQNYAFQPLLDPMNTTIKHPTQLRMNFTTHETMRLQLKKIFSTFDTLICMYLSQCRTNQLSHMEAEGLWFLVSPGWKQGWQLS